MADLKKKFEEEIEGAKAYWAMGQHDEENKNMFEDMAWEEMSHAEIILEMMGNPEDLKKTYKEIEKTMIHG